MEERDSLVFAAAERRIASFGDGSRGAFLDRMQLATLPSSIGQLTEVNELFLTRNRLQQLPAEIGNLKKLRRLGVSDNCLQTLPHEIGKLSELTHLFALRNNIRHLPATIGNLTNLVGLYLWGNELKQLPREIGSLRKLRVLNLTRNRLVDLPTSIRDLSSLEELYLQGNPDLRIPAEILGPSSGMVMSFGLKPTAPGKILEFYFRARNSPLLEARLMIVGDGGVGKTSLARQLISSTPASGREPTTKDVDFHDWHMEVRSEPVKLSVWDFAGQQVLHSAHRLFFTTERTLYLVVVSARDGQAEERIDYWLKMISTHGAGARALIVVNRVDEHPMDLKKRDLCARYAECLPENVKDAFYATSCTAGVGIEALRSGIARELSEMEQVWALIPNEWFRVKQKLASAISAVREARADAGLPRAETMTLDEWIALCAGCGLTDASEQSDVLNLMRNLGLVVAFPDDPQLGGLGVLNPDWLTRAAYAILTSFEIAAAGGLLSINDLSLILPASRYPRHRHAWIVEVMKKCELIFGDDDNRLIVPARLPKDTPEWADDAMWSRNDILRLEMRYAVLLETVISRFIARKHKKATAPSRWWRHGIELQDFDCKALIKADVARAVVEVWIEGSKIHRRQFIGALLDTLRDVTQPDEGDLWVVLGGAHRERFADLLQLAADGDRQIRRVVRGRTLTFELEESLDIVGRADQRSELMRLSQVVEIGDMTRSKQTVDKSNITGKLEQRSQAQESEQSVTSSEAHELMQVSKPISFDLLKLAAELRQLRKEMKRQDGGDDAKHDMALGHVASAEAAASSGDESGALANLKKAGKWALEVAEKVGVEVAVSAIKVATGLSSGA